MSDVLDPSKLKVAELRVELQSRGLDTKGNKPVLIERLREALEIEESEKAQEEEMPEEAQEVDVPEEAHDEEIPEENLQQKDVTEENDGNSDEITAEKEVTEESGNDKTEEKEALPEEEDKLDYEEAPVEEVMGEDELEEKEGYEEQEVPPAEEDDKSAVDFIKDDFFNGHTEDFQDLEEDATQEAKEETEVKEEEEIQQEVVKQEAPAEEMEQEESWDHKRGTKRSANNSTLDEVKEESATTEDQAPPQKKAKQESEVSIIAQEEAPFDQTLCVLDWYNSDLSLKIDKEKRLSASPLWDKGFAFMWHGARATYGFTKGLVCYEVMLESNTNANVEGEEHPYVLRVGWSVDDSSYTLGEERNSWGYGGTGKASTNLKFKSYGCEFKTGDVVGAFLNMDVTPYVMSFSVNGNNQGICYEIDPAELNGSALFPHILTKNVNFKVNFGDEEPYSQLQEGYTYAGQVPLEDRIQGSQGPVNREDCEVIMMVGLPASGKTTWVGNYCSENKHKKYNVLGTNDLIDKMKVGGLPRKRNYAGRWDQLISNCTKCLNELLRLSYNRNRNYIIDQTNVYPTAQKRKIRGFLGFNRRAVVICPSDDALKERKAKREKEEGKDVPDSAILEMKANFKLPEVGEFFDSVEFIELQREESQTLVDQYNKEGVDANPHRYGNNSGPTDWGSMSSNANNGGGRGRGFGGRRDFGGDRRDNRYRGGWDRDRDRRGGYDRRGGWNNNRNNRDFGGRSGNRDNNRGGGYNNRNSSNYRGYNNQQRNNRYNNRDSQGNNRYQDNYNNSSSSSGSGYNNQSGSYGTGYGSGYSSYGSGASNYSNQSSYGGQQQSSYQQQPQSGGYGSWNSGGYYGQQQSYYTQQPQTQTQSYGNWGQQTQQWNNNAQSTSQSSAWGSGSGYGGQSSSSSWGGQQSGGYGSYGGYGKK